MPLSRKNVTLTAVCFYVESKVGKTGLTVTCDVYRVSDGTQEVTGGACTELGGGFYKYVLAAGVNNADRDSYAFAFKTATSTVDQQHLPALWVVDSTFLASTSDGTATFVTAVDGADLTARLSRTWSFASVTTADVSAYENLVFSVKKNTRVDTDAEAILRVDQAIGLERIGGAAPVAASNATLTGSTTTFTVKIADAETAATSVLLPGRYTWELVGEDATPSPVESYVLAVGVFIIKDSALLS